MVFPLDFDIVVAIGTIGGISSSYSLCSMVVLRNKHFFPPQATLNADVEFLMI